MTGIRPSRQGETFSSRHVGAITGDRGRMLATLQVESLTELIGLAAPADILASVEAPGMPPATDEAGVRHELAELASRNRPGRPLIGRGYHGTITPAVIRRNVLENPSWYTAYTPYQPEISQGRLEALITFQQMVEDLTALDVANSSLLDEATAAAEAMLLARRASRATSSRFLVGQALLEQVRTVLAGRAEALGIELVTADLTDRNSWGPQVERGCFGVLADCPDGHGRVWNPAALFDAVHTGRGICVAECDILALALIVPPGELGADVAVGSTQRFGVPLGFGGPHAGYMAVRKGLERQLPGRLVGTSRDADGIPAYRLALQTREQHIRRDRATSNICTAQVLLAVMAAMYAVWHGPQGIRAIASQVHRRTVRLAEGLRAAGFGIGEEPFFDTVRIPVPGGAEELWQTARRAGFTLDLIDGDTIGISLDETVTDEEIDQIIGLCGDGPTGVCAPRGADAGWEWPTALIRTSDYLTHPVFTSFGSETAMMRYLKRLADRDFGLDRGMIPLGSCTMKLNAAIEMEPISWPAFADLHPYAPAVDAEGSLAMIADLETWLAQLTGYDTVSLQPNAGSQGEYAGLLAIRGYHRSRGDDGRRVCLVPSSAHGTNAASAALAGMRVVVVASDDGGNIDPADLAAKIATHADELAAIMITYPSTHGVYEAHVRKICRMVHDAGGQVYIDGANLNALLGVARPGEIGGDVSHLNLHKTFAIPHGGGGPGVGPLAAKAHLAPFMPGSPVGTTVEHPLADGGTVRHTGHPVAAATYGSAGVLPISWAYLRLMGLDGLREATGQAVLSANYVARRLQSTIPVLYTGANGLVAHECILDIRPLTHDTGITVDDVAKRLIDYGFHAPTMSFPVAGTLMVEPTESEDVAELDRFCDAMLAIVDEARKVAAGDWPAEDNPLVNAPHPAPRLLDDEWSHPYSRKLAAYPGTAASAARDAEAGLHVNPVTRIQAKYWPPVGRIDNAFGDRHLMCSCPPPEAFEEH
ncbi:aminomethyl-transferring glycine dehydrogenase [Acidipropionibacterium virtanenii]|uniref:Glycine dehydrogenase (decarboxylating) n=1 Tax=Acidipropionibacterium virtanenii TaxID=2057246 RepID=A0A344UVB1_9ACTN|nr:aminomethyl-transferring glycine dehydrogenase [Acidipropionibacterium virtanenii]AXE39209.1 putative glycine dehydrogenase (decarboxylating) [Acidipropionibacterium virtanenii]